MKRSFIILLLGLIATCGWADDGKRIPFDECFTGAANRFSVNKVVLVAIAQTESQFNPGAIGPINENGSFDIGLMQINSWWFPKLEALGIKSRDLLNACNSIYVGAWILSQNIKIHGNTWKAVGAYNANSPLKQVVYVNKVMLSSADVRQNYLFK